MVFNHSFFQTCKPGIPKKYLLLVAAMVWTFAGGILLYRGFSILKFTSAQIEFEETGCLLAGIVFYRFMFSRISLKHINRILQLKIERPCFFSFFNWRSYFMMSLMMTVGITLRLTGIIPITWLSLFYISMGTPLFISAIRFYIYAVKNILQNKNNQSSN